MKVRDVVVSARVTLEQSNFIEEYRKWMKYNSLLEDFIVYTGPEDPSVEAHNDTVRGKAYQKVYGR